VRISFLMVAVWWLVFSLPLMLLVDEPGGEKTGPTLTRWRIKVNIKSLEGAK